MVDLYRVQIVAPGKQALFVLLVAFILTFLFIRLSVRMIRAGVSWWPGNISSGDVHIHHVVFGTLFMLVSGVLTFAPSGWESPWWEVLAALFGIGAALVLDEFALILHLDDVYWSEKGRKSIDAVVLAAAVTALLVLGALPFGVDGFDGNEPLSGWAYVGIVLVDGALVGVALLKGRVWLGVLGLLFPVLALIGAVRLGRPDSLWGRRWYRPGSWRLTRSLSRTQRHEARWERLKHRIFDAVAGRPDAEPPSVTR